MNQRLLLGSTALVSAGILLAGTAPAQAEIRVTLGGYTEFGLEGATDETLQDDPDRGYTYFMDNEVHITAEGTSDTGLVYGSYLEIEAGSGESPSTQGAPDSAGEAFVDEVNLFFADGFGRIELGRQDGAEDVMFVGGEDAQSGTGGVDGDTNNLATVINVHSGDYTKATYFTPRIAGFQLGVNYAPDRGDDGGRDAAPFDNNFENVVGFGANWVGAFGGVDLTLSAVGIAGKGEGNNNSGQDDDLLDYSVGALIGAGGLSFGATWGQLTDADEADFAHLGLKYKFGNASASVGYTYNDVNAFNDTEHVFVVSGDIGLMPGVTLKGDVSYNTEDPGKDDGLRTNPGDPSQGDTLAGVLSVQLDY